MSLGHGQLGLSDRLPTFHDLMADSSAERKVYLSFYPGKTINGPNDPDIWTVDTGSVYKTNILAYDLTLAGVIRAIVAVETMAGTRSLVRRDRLADMSAGTWFYDDSALVAGGSTFLYVWLSTGADPDTTTMVMHVLFTFGQKGEAHPVFGDEYFANNDLETWSGGNPSSWTEVGAGAVTAQETAIVLSGLSSAKIGSATMSAGAFLGIEQTGIGVADSLYRVSGYYQTPFSGQAPEVEVRLRIGKSTPLRLLSDGRSLTVADEGFRLADTYGEWKRFMFDFRWAPAPDGTVDLVAGIFVKNTAGSSKSGFVYVDRMFFRRIHRFTLFSANLTAASIPEMEIRSANNLFGPKSIAIGSISISDGDGEYAKAFAQLLLLNRPAMVQVGGAFSNGAEIYRDDWRGAFPALTRTPEITDQGIAFELDDARALTHVVTNRNVYRVGDFSTMARSDEGKPKPLVFGTPFETGGATIQHIIPATRVIRTANGYGEYEYLDPDVPVRDGIDVDVPTGHSIKTFPNKDLADRNVGGRELMTLINASSVANPSVISCFSVHGLVTGDVVDISYHAGSTPNINGSHTVTVITALNFSIPVNVTTGGAGGQFTNRSDFILVNNKTRWRILRDIRDMRYNGAGNDVGSFSTFDFNIGGAALVANTYIGGPAYRTAAELQFLMNTAAGVADITVVYNESTHKFTVAKGAGVLQLIMSGTTAANRQKQSWKLLGFDTTADKTGALTYTGANPTFTDVDVDHVLRFNGGGYRDDSSGSICGTASVALNTPAAVASWLLQKVCNVPAANMAIPTFAAGRTESMNDFCVIFRHLSGGDVSTVLGELEQVGIANLVVDGDGVWHWKRHVASSAGAREFFDRDYLSWRMWQDPSMIYRAVQVYGDYNPSLERYMTIAGEGSVIDTGIPIKHGAEGTLKVMGGLERQYITGGTQMISNYYSRLVGKVPRIVEFSARGRLTDLLVGDKIKLTRARAFDVTGAISSLAFRLTSLRHNFLTGVSTCTACEDVVFLS